MSEHGGTVEVSEDDDTWEGDPKKWWILVAMTGALSMVLIDATVVSVALPTIQHDLDMTTTELQWIVNAYLLTLAAFVALGGRIADIVGRRTIFLVGIVVFVAASACSGASHIFDSGEMLIAARAAQGLGAAMMIPSSQAIVTSAFPVSQRGTAMGVYAGISVAFLALGPLLGGLLTEHVGWEWVFYINLPVGIATIAVTLWVRPANQKEPDARLDIPGAILLVVGLGAVVIALMQSTVWGWSDPRTIGLLAGGALLLVVFVAVELRVSQPLIDLRLFGSGNFSTDVGILFIVQFALMGVSVFGSIFAQDVLGFDPVQAGLAMLPMTIPIVVLAMAVGRAYDRLGPRVLVSIGCFVGAAGLLLTGYFVTDLDYSVLVPGYVLVGAGVAFIMTPTNTDAMNASPIDKRGQASGLIQTARQVGGSVGMAVLTTIIVSVQNNQLDDNLEELGLTSTQAKDVEGALASAQQSGSSSTALTDKLSGEQLKLADEVIAAMQDAFASSLRVGFVLVGALLAIGGVLAVTLLRKIEFSDEGGAAGAGF